MQCLETACVGLCTYLTSCSRKTTAVNFCRPNFVPAPIVFSRVCSFLKELSTRVGGCFAGIDYAKSFIVPLGSFDGVLSVEMMGAVFPGTH